MPKKTLFIITVLLIISKIALNAQLNLSFKHITTENGLPDAPNTILQDTLGYIWIGTNNGLSRFNGYELKNYYSADDTTTLTHPVIYDMLVDKTNTLWVASQHGLNRYNRAYDNFTRFYLPEVSNQAGANSNRYFHTITTDKNGNAYFLDESGTICKYNYTTKTIELLTNEKIKYTVKSASFDSDGMLWIGTSHGFAKLNVLTKKITYYDSDNYFNQLKNEVWTIEEYNNKLWIGTLGDNDLFIFDKNSETLTPFIHPNKVKSFHNYLFIDSQNRLWIGTLAGVFVYNQQNNVLHHIKNNPNDITSLGNDVVLGIFEDEQHNIWLIHDKGVSYSNQNTNFTTYTKQANDMALPAGAIDIDENNILWVGNNQSRLIGFNHRQNIISDEINNSNTGGMINSDIKVVYVYNSQDLYFGHYFGGLLKYNMNTRKLIEYRPNPNDSTSICGTDVRSISQDKDGNLWIISHGHGFCKFIPETGKFVNFNISEEDNAALGGQWAFDVVVDKNNIVWIAHTSGISEFNPETQEFTHYSHNPDDTLTIGSNDVTGGVWIDPLNNFWVATQKGLNFFDVVDRNFTRFNTDNGLPDNKIQSVITDQDTNVWVAHGAGLCMLSFKNKRRPKPWEMTVKNYTKEDGTGNDTYIRRSIVKDPYGTIYVGGEDAVTAFNPRNITENKFLPKVQFTNFYLMNQAVKIGKSNDENEFRLQKHINELKQLTLRYNQNILTFRYVGINLNQPTKNQYAYMMDGFEDDWQYVGSKREATYTNLSPGKYTFKVKAANNDGYWNNKARTIDIIITPPWWQTWWFRILMLITIGSVILKIINDKQKKVKRDKAILQQKINEGDRIIEQKMREVEEQQEEIKIREKREYEMKYFTEGIAQFSEIISKFRGEISDLSSKISSALVDYTGINTAGVYLIDENKEQLLPNGVFCNNSVADKISGFKPGEGYAGTCYSEQKVIEMDNIPEGTFVLESGLGKTSLRYCLFVPILQESECFGVIELAGLKKLKKFQVEFISKVAENFGSVVAISRSNEQLKIILEQNKQQAEEMSAQEEEMRQNLEELQSTQEMFQRTEDTLKQKIETYKSRVSSIKEILLEKGIELDDSLFELPE